MIPINWHNSERTILYVKFPVKWSWKEVYAVVKQAMKHMEEVDHLVDTIYDVGDTRSLPMGTLSDLPRIINITHPNERLVVIISQSTFIKMMVDMAMLFAPNKETFTYRYADSVEHALTIIENYQDVATASK